MWGGGSETTAADVSVESGMADAGVEDRRSMYEMNDNRFVTFLGEGGRDGKGAGTVIDVNCWGLWGSECRGCSVCVAVVGEEEFESASEPAVLDVAE